MEGAAWTPTVSGLSRSMVLVEPDEFVDAESQPSAEAVSDPIPTGAAPALNPGDAEEEQTPEEESRPTGAATVLNPGSSEAAEVREPAAEVPSTPASVRAESAADEDEVRPLSSNLLAESQGVKRSRTGSSKAGSSAGGSWTLADLDRLSSALTLQVLTRWQGLP